MVLLNPKKNLFLKQLLLFILIIAHMGCEQQEVQDVAETEYYNCVSYVDGANITYECITISSISPVEWLYESEYDCLSGCGNYNCINNDCVTEYGGQYSEENDCLTICGGDDVLNYGYNCIGYDCVFEENGQYETVMDCFEICDDYGYNCIDDDCLFEENGQYTNLDECVNICNYGYNCLDGDCLFEENGQYATLDECVNNCEDIYEGEVLFYLYDGVPNTIYNESGEISVYFDIGDENNLNFVEVGNVSTITQSGYMITPLCVDNINVVLVNVLTTQFGSTTYSWRLRNFFNTEYYDFGTFMIENDECISIEVDLK